MTPEAVIKTEYSDKQNNIIFIGNNKFMIDVGEC